MSGPGPVTAAASLLRPLPAPGSPVPFPLGLSSGLAAPGNPQSSPGPKPTSSSHERGHRHHGVPQGPSARRGLTLVAPGDLSVHGAAGPAPAGVSRASCCGQLPTGARGQAPAASALASASGLGEAVRSPELVGLVGRLCFISSLSASAAPPQPPLLIPATHCSPSPSSSSPFTSRAPALGPGRGAWRL